MIDLLITNFIYVIYRLAVSGVLVKFLLRHVSYYVAVFIAAQFSFIYDTLNFYYYFGAENLDILNLLSSDIIYTLRVLAAWFIIKRIWDWTGNYWLSVFIGAEMTFVIDYFIIGSIALR